MPPEVARSILKPVSFAELSTHDRFTWVLAAAVATSPVGAAGGKDKVVTETAAVGLDEPVVLTALTRYE